MNTQDLKSWQRIKKRVSIKPTGCWEWTGYRSPEGYGYVMFRAQTQPAHRAVYKLLTEYDPLSFRLHHLCENKICVNPSHLTQVTDAHHMLLSPAWVAYKKRKQSHCKRGHELAGYNLMVRTDGRRNCRACHLAFVVASKERTRSSSMLT